ncbi:MAG: RNHCP domain-containing protein [Planctomycetales bacterium]|nr:RNHCP domain-containing protein [Planctomycetales bacterium]
MTIRFTCEHCGQRLSVNDSNAGRRAKCPKCKQSLHVPGEPVSAEAAGAANAAGSANASGGAAHSASDLGGADSAERPSATSDADASTTDYPAGEQWPADESDAAGEDAYSQFAVYDEWVFDTGEIPDAKKKDDRPVDEQRVAVPRAALYTQGVLLAVVALVFFILGLMTGSSGSGGGANDAPQACVIEGSVARQESGQTVPDDGAIVVILPQNARPDPTNKFPAQPLMPGSSSAETDQQLRGGIRDLGGDFVRVDATGEFTLNVPDRGKYFVLVLSRSAARPPGELPKPTDLAQIGRYFLPADELLGNSRYVWQDETVRGDRRMKFDL